MATINYLCFQQEQKSLKRTTTVLTLLFTVVVVALRCHDLDFMSVQKIVLNTQAKKEKQHSFKLRYPAFYFLFPWYFLPRAPVLREDGTVLLRSRLLFFNIF